MTKGAWIASIVLLSLLISLAISKLNNTVSQGQIPANLGQTIPAITCLWHQSTWGCRKVKTKSIRRLKSSCSAQLHSKHTDQSNNSNPKTSASSSPTLEFGSRRGLKSPSTTSGCNSKRCSPNTLTCLVFKGETRAMSSSSTS